jgi:hypothetical protein
MLRSLTLTCSLAALLAGCNSPHSEDNMPGRQNLFSGDTFRAAQVNKAIITQRTIWAYHFVTNTAELNPLGMRDLSVLAGYFAQHKGDVRIRRSGASQVLYDARVAAVVNSMVAAGVSKNQITVTDAPPGGTGVASERVVTVLSEGLALSQGASGGSSGSTGTGMSSSTSP